MRVTATKGDAATVLVGVGAGLAIVALLVVQAVNETSNAMSGQQAVDAVNNSFATHMSLLASQNVTALLSEYAANATITWVAKPNVPLPSGQNGIQGNYTGKENMKILLNYFFGRFAITSFAIENATSTTAPADDGEVTVNSGFGFSGESNIYGNINGTISALDSYSSANGSWLIAHETWNFTSLKLQYPIGNF